MSTNPYAAIDMMFSGTVKTLAIGAKVNLAVPGTSFSVITPVGGTAKISRVNDHSTTTHGTGVGRALADQAADTFAKYSGTDWPYYVLEAVTQPLSYYAPPQ